MRVRLLGFEKYPEWKNAFLTLFQHAHIETTGVGKADLAIIPHHLYLLAPADGFPWVGIWIEGNIMHTALLMEYARLGNPPREILHYDRSGIMFLHGTEVLDVLRKVLDSLPK